MPVGLRSDNIPGRNIFGAFALSALLFALSGCSTARPWKHERRGLFDQLGGEPARRPSGSKISSGEASRDPASSVREMRLLWPLKTVIVTSPFGRRGDGYHEGVDLRATVGTPVYAAQSGKVLYSDRRIRGYGRMIVIQHPNGVATVYAHNSRMFVRKGQKIKQGQKIALSGSSGHSTGPHVHFEIRYGVSAIDPLNVLPRASRAALDSVDTVPGESPSVETPKVAFRR